MELLGHSSIGVTMDIYAHVMPAMMRETAESMDAILTAPEEAKSG
jgi:integrase